jgi:TolB-like protein/class 3 adenylate cyclase/tetratricopeptide (TPR) repeat protein
MTDSTPISKLAAILAADVVGFSLKMGENEYLTLKNLKACRAIVDSAIKNNQGRIFTTAGDSVIAEFASPVNAIVAAVEFQKNIMARNAACAEEDQMQFRVGLNLGDVIVEGDNLYGDGVNVAARIESSAEAGGIHMSAKFYEEVRRKLDLSFESLGDQQLKNISEPISTYRVNLGVEGTKTAKSQPSTPSSGAKKEPSLLAKLFGTPLKKGISASVAVVVLTLGGYWGVQQGSKPSINPLSIAVLPFANLTGDPSQAYVAEGMTSQVTRDLSRITNVLVTDSAKTIQYKDKSIPIQQVGKDLGVRFILKGEVQRSDNKVLINATLTDTKNNKLLWSDSFEGEMSNLFALQNQVTTRISGSLGKRIVVVAAIESESRKTNPQAADLILRARAESQRGGSLDSLNKIENLYRQALTLEPNNITAMSMLSLNLAMLGPRGIDQNLRKPRFEEAYELALKVKEIDPNDRIIYQTLGLYFREKDDLESAISSMEKFIQVNNNKPHLVHANLLMQSGEPKRAQEIYKQIFNSDPLNPSDILLTTYGRSYFFLGDVDTAIQYYLKANQINSKVASNWANLAVAYTAKGETEKAALAVAEVKKWNPNANLSTNTFVFKPMSASPQSYKDWFEKKYLPLYRKAGLPE